MSNITDLKLQNETAFSLFERNQKDLQLSQVAEEFEALFVSEMLKQAQNAPIPVEEQVCVIYTGINGYLDDVAVDEVKSFLGKLRTYLKSSAPQLLTTIKSEQKLSPESEETLKKAITDAKAM